jgi:hypothetical protein
MRAEIIRRAKSGLLDDDSCARHHRTNREDPAFWTGIGKVADGDQVNERRTRHPQGHRSLGVERRRATFLRALSAPGVENLLRTTEDAAKEKSAKRIS